MRSFEVLVPPERRGACFVRVGAGAVERLPSDLERLLRTRNLAVVSDARVARLHGRKIARRLAKAGFHTHVLTFPPGERSKTRETKSRLEDRLFDLGIGRDVTIVAVGGGVTGDLAGFLASTWHRGVPIVQVPTTLLAMVDSSLGGKTGVDLPGGKNLVGTFLQPTAVYADVDLLATLPRRQFLLGFAEVVKTAVIADATFFRWLESNATALRAGETRSLAHAIERCLRIKARIVAQDERESGRRAVLNFGHTVAHAIEAASGYRIPHGRAVAIGLAVESRLAVVATGFSAESSERIASLLRAIGLPARWPRSLEVDRVLEATRRDKKAREGQARYALPTSLGRMPAADATTVAVAEKALRRAVQESCAGAPG